MTERAVPSPTDPLASEQEASLLAQGRAYYAQAQYQEALSCLHLAYDKLASRPASDRDAQSQAAEIANDLGVVYTVLKRWQEAVQWLDEAQQRFANEGNLDGEAQTLGNLGSMYRARGDLRQAAACLQLSADRFHLVGDNERRAALLRALCVVRLCQLRPLQAVATYRDVLGCHPHPNWLVRLLRGLLGLPFRLQQR